MPFPTKYRPEMCELTFKVCLLGATNEQLAAILGVDVETMRDWQVKHAEFGDAVRRGKDEADAQVAHSLYRRALGYRHIAFKMFQHEGKVLTKRYVEHFPPDPTSCIFWLKNRRPDVWRDRHEFTGANGGAIEHKLENVTDIEAARQIAFAMAEGAQAVQTAKTSGNAAAKKPKKESA